VQQQKVELRKSMRACLKSLSTEERFKKSLIISRLIRDCDFRTTSLGVYSALENEVDWSLSFSHEEFLYVNFLENNQIGFFPSSKENLKNLVWKNKTFKVPNSNELKEVVPQILLVPGLAMSKKGQRLGRGGGFYDRYLEHFTGLKIGLTFDCCLLETLPEEDHDQLMDWVISESGIIKIRRTQWPCK
jgi:5-formyltetrahydrofolate cyclo-ligase